MEKFFRLTTFVAGLVVVVMLVQNITVTKMTKLREAQMLSSPDIVSIKTRERQLECLAMNIYREAGHENFEGKVAVVIDRVICQFSWYCDTAHKARPVNPAAYNESMAVAKKVLLEGFRLDVMKEALYYHANYVNPRWNLEKIGSIGNHIFYNGKN